MADLRVDNTPPMAKVAYLFYQHRAGTGGSPSSDREMETGCYLPSPQVSSSSELPHPSPSHSRSPDTQGVEKRDTSHVASDGVRQRSYVNGDPILHQASISQSRGNHITTSHSRRSRRSPPAASQHASLQTVNLALAVGPSPGILKASGTRPDVGHRLGPNSAASTPNAPYPTSASLRTLRRSTTPHPSANPPPLYCYEAVHARSAENSAKSSSKRSGRRTPPSSSPQDRSSSHRLVSGRRPPPSSRYAKFQAGHTSSGAQLPEFRRSARTFDDKPVQTDAESSAIPLPSGGAEVRTESPPSHVTLPLKDVGAQSALRSSPQPPFVMLPLKAGSSRMEAGSAVPRITSSRQDKTLFQGDGVRLGTRLVHPLSRSPTSPSRSRGSRPRFTGQLNATSNSLGQTPLSQRSLACVVPIQVPEGLMPPTVVAVASSIYPEDGLPAGETHLVKFEQGGRPDAFPVDEVPPAQVGARVMAHHSPQATPRDAELHSRFEVLHEPAELDAILAEALGTAVLLTEKELPPLPYERMSEHLFQQHDWPPIEQLSSVPGSDYEDTHPLLSTPSTHPSRHDESHRLCDGGAESDKRLSRLISKLTCGFIKPRIQNAPLDPQEEEKEKLWQKLLQRADAAGGTLYLDATNGRRVLKRAEQSTICFAA